MRLTTLAAEGLLAFSLATSPLQSAFFPPAFATPPTAEQQAQLRKGFQAAQAGLPASADSLLSKSIVEWERSSQPADEISALYKTRGMVRADLSRLSEASDDLSRA